MGKVAGTKWEMPHIRFHDLRHAAATNTNKEKASKPLRLLAVLDGRGGIQTQFSAFYYMLYKYD